MTVATDSRRRPAPITWRDAVELLASMRFAIALLTVICIAAVIGTVLQQGQPALNYANQFGPFWAEVFGTLGLYTVYSAWWFLLILAFLVTSTSLCIARNAPKIWHDLRTFKERLREQSLSAFHHKAEGHVAESLEQAHGRITRLLAEGGWKLKTDVRPTGVMVAAKKGSVNRLGYLAAHAAIVLICVGGLLDGDLAVRIQMWARGITPFGGGPLSAEEAKRHRLSVGNPAFRANLPVTEGTRGDVALINLPSGLVLQPLDFDVELKRFKVEYYPTGMPRLFASDIVIHDHATGRATPATVEVNKPVFHNGVAIYQSSFEDGGSRLKLVARPLAGGPPVKLEGRIGSSQSLPPALSAEPLTLELTDLRVINVENLGGDRQASSGTDVRRVDLAERLESHLGAGNKTRTEKTLRNVGPSVSYKLRDASGQAREFHNYMLPLELDGQMVFLAGMRESPAEPMRYLRIPADTDARPDGWLRLRAALLNEAARDEAVRRFVTLALPRGREDLAPQLSASAARALGVFAGAVPAREDGPANQVGGLQGLSDMIEATVPAPERERASEVLLRILNGSLFELLNYSRAQAGQPPLEPGESTQRFMSQAVLSLSDASFYPAPVWVELESFEHVQASVFQVAKAPGKTIVYLGCLFLVIGVFAMLYVRERRLWVWLQDTGFTPTSMAASTLLRTALSCNRQTLDTDREFDALKRALLQGATPAEAS